LVPPGPQAALVPLVRRVLQEALVPPGPRVALVL
jgi:hypothetical protein